jgi:hypothetical protein
LGSLNVTGNITGGNLSGTSIAGTLTTASQTNITSVGTLGSLNVTANVAGGNLTTGGVISATGNIFAGNIIVVGGFCNTNDHLVTSLATNANIVLTPTGTGITQNNGPFSASGNVTGSNFLTGGLISAAGTVTGSQFNGSGAGLTSIPGANVTGTVPNATTATYVTGLTSGNVTTALGFTPYNATNPSGYQTSSGTVATVSGAAQTNITSVGTLTSLNVSGAITVNSGSAATAIVNGAGNAVGNIGSASNYFNTIFGKATTAQYADLAENYLADAAYVPGTVLDFDGELEVTLSTRDSSKRVAGVVSTNPAHLMNSTLDGAHVTAVALVGRVPVQVTGTIAKGDLMVSAGNGRARAEANPAIGTVIGKALENFDGGEGTIEIVICMQ